MRAIFCPVSSFHSQFNPLECKGNYSATSNNMKSVGTLAVDGLAVTFGTASMEPTHALPRCTKCNSQPINGQCTNQWQSPYCCKWSTVLRFNVGIKVIHNFARMFDHQSTCVKFYDVSRTLTSDLRLKASRTVKCRHTCSAVSS